MQIERNYYTEDKQLWEKIRCNVEAKQAQLTEDERQQKQECYTAEIRALMAKAEQELKDHPKMPDYKRLAQFQKLTKAALWLAEYCDLDVRVDITETCYGVIQLETDFFLFNDLCPPRISSVLRQLLATANEFSISHTPTTFVLTFFFDLHGIPSTW